MRFSMKERFTLKLLNTAKIFYEYYETSCIFSQSVLEMPIIARGVHWYHHRIYKILEWEIINLGEIILTYFFGKKLLEKNVKIITITIDAEWCALV